MMAPRMTKRCATSWAATFHRQQRQRQEKQQQSWIHYYNNKNHHRNNKYYLSSSSRAFSSSFWQTSTTVAAAVVATAMTATDDNDHNGKTACSPMTATAAIAEEEEESSTTTVAVATGTSASGMNGDTSDSTRAMTTTTTTTTTIVDAPEEKENEEIDAIVASFQFPERILRYDDYQGVTIHLEKCTQEEQTSLQLNHDNPLLFQQCLSNALEVWKERGKKGIWIHCPIQYATLIPIATALEFEFHRVHEKTMLVLNRWLPTDKVNKLPLGPTHQVGVGCFVPCPWNATHLLVVQEKTGPAAASGLWKMPTGLSDPGEDIHVAAERELLEETGLTAHCQGIVAFRQAHGSRSSSGPRAATSDLFFVCHMQLQLPPGYNHDDDDDPSDQFLFRPCEDEIAAIQWMSVQDYCNQERWQKSPAMMQLNKATLALSLQQQQLQQEQEDKSATTTATTTTTTPIGLLKPHTLPLGFGTRISTTLYNFVHLAVPHNNSSDGYKDQQQQSNL